MILVIWCNFILFKKLVRFGTQILVTRVQRPYLLGSSVSRVLIFLTVTFSCPMLLNTNSVHRIKINGWSKKSMGNQKYQSPYRLELSLSLNSILFFTCSTSRLLNRKDGAKIIGRLSSLNPDVTNLQNNAALASASHEEFTCGSFTFLDGGLE